MKVGVNLINFGPGAAPETLARWAALAETLGYHFLMISDHVASTPDVEAAYPAPFYDPFVTLGWLAGRTERIELGTTVVILPYRHPLLTARMAANLDQLSGGRLIFGVGAGWARDEFAALGVPFEQRGAITDDDLAVIAAFWAADELAYAGTTVATAPRPLRAPRPPLWVGGNGAAAWRRAARYGDAWHPINIRVDWLREVGLPGLQAAARAEGRPVPALCPRIRLRLTDEPLDDATRRAGEGTLAQVRGDLAQMEALGSTHVLLDPYAGDPQATRSPEGAWAMLARLAAEVVDLPGERLR